MMRLALLAFLALVLAACGSGGDDEEGSATPAGEGAQTIEIVGTEYALEPATVELDEPGTYTLVFRNEGDSTVHALEVEGHGIEEETEEIGAGESAELTVELAEAGEYELYCPVDDHRHLGMEGTIVVGGGAGTTEETTTDETTTDETTADDDGGSDY